MARSECYNVNPECQYFEQGCYADNHHLAWPKRDYRTSIERAYRNLPENQVQLCRAEHDEVHFEDPPDKPSRAEMLGAIALESEVA